MTVYAVGQYPLGVVSISRTASAVTLIFKGLPGNTYQPQYTNSLTGASWTNDGSVLAAGSDGRFTYVEAAQPQPPQLAMTLVLGPKAPLDYSVWSAAAGAFLLAAASGKPQPTHDQN